MQYKIQRVVKNPPRPTPTTIEAPSATEALTQYAAQHRLTCQALQPYGTSGRQALIGTNTRGWRQYVATPA
jgi:hypothetical protein